MTWLAGNNSRLLTPQNQPAPGEDEDPPNNPGIIDENELGREPAILPDFHENWASWRQPPNLTIEGLPKPIGFELGKASGGPNWSQPSSLTLAASVALFAIQSIIVRGKA